MSEKKITREEKRERERRREKRERNKGKINCIKRGQNKQNGRETCKNIDMENHNLF